MIQFILEDDSPPICLRKGSRTYAILDVVRPVSDSSVNSEISEDDTRQSIISHHFSSISSRMVSLFFEEIESPDPLWSDTEEAEE